MHGFRQPSHIFITSFFILEHNISIMSTIKYLSKDLGKLKKHFGQPFSIINLGGGPSAEDGQYSTNIVNRL